MTRFTKMLVILILAAAIVGGTLLVHLLTRPNKQASAACVSAAQYHAAHPTQANVTTTNDILCKQ